MLTQPYQNSGPALDYIVRSLRLREATDTQVSMPSGRLLGAAERWAVDFRGRKRRNPRPLSRSGVSYRSLTMTYSHMEKLHTTIGDASFHY